jgi:hypothetical protein
MTGSQAGVCVCSISSHMCVHGHLCVHACVYACGQPSEQSAWSNLVIIIVLHCIMCVGCMSPDCHCRVGRLVG